MADPNVYNINAVNPKENKGFLGDLLARAKNGQQSAFGQIYNHFFKKIYTFIYYRVGHKEVAEDLTEDVFLKAYKKIASINNDASFESWLYQIARNKVIDYYRDKKITVALDEIENSLEYETNVVEVINLEEQQIVLLKILKELGPEQQAVLKMKFFEELDNATIAALMNKTEGAIRVIQHRAIVKLQELIKENKLN
jgi:RNA polymerase sigma-70 factor, ECF subfamily